MNRGANLCICAFSAVVFTTESCSPAFHNSQITCENAVNKENYKNDIITVL